MKILFLTLAYPPAESHNIYTDLLDEFIVHGHEVFVVCQNERRNKTQTAIVDEDRKTVLRVRSLNILGDVGMAEKGAATLTIDKVFIRAVKRYLLKQKFDVILYSTPPITLGTCVRYFKRRDNAHTYLLLKDIFPQNAVDLCMMRERGILHRYFRRKERQLYALSDHIGCMSPANVEYLLKHNPEVDPSKVHVLPNSIIPQEIHRSEDAKLKQREKYGIPQGAIVFIYGGNMGKPQDVPFIVKCLRSVSDREDCFFIMCGDGSDYGVLETYVKAEKPQNVLLINSLPKREYDELLQACDVGVLFLDHRFTIPNFPSRMLSYMNNSMMILACTDPSTDVGKIITDGGFGWWCASDSVDGFTRTVDEACCADLHEMGSTGYAYLAAHYTVEGSYKTILENLK